MRSALYGNRAIRNSELVQITSFNLIIVRSKLLWTRTKRLFDEIKLILCRFYHKSSQTNSKLETYKDEFGVIRFRLMDGISPID